MDEQKMIEMAAMQSRSDAWFAVWDLCIKLGMKVGHAKSGVDDVLDFIRQAVEQTDTESTTPDTDKL